MQTLDQWAEFFGWATLLNFGLLTLVTLILLALQGWMLPLHQKLFKLAEQDVRVAYFRYLANYKLFTLVFFAVPYVALKIMIAS
ncbi:DUF6868 family protein [Pleionea litopenaei]|uniref:DUF6868 domain-containing protein n=1 Tax=Pleionea litopenaei TaxID=3070815 RepID=A0AA51RRK2_9GAMM|nr:hypothetical protein [Pleionea sp. HL-JVS1]WMS86252.1 hypothetical protein Q9312_13590 [Pleionea sp. HL-JVS1]